MNNEESSILFLKLILARSLVSSLALEFARKGFEQANAAAVEADRELSASSHDPIARHRLACHAELARLRVCLWSDIAEATFREHAATPERKAAA